MPPEQRQSLKGARKFRQFPDCELISRARRSSRRRLRPNVLLPSVNDRVKCAESRIRGSEIDCFSNLMFSADLPGYDFQCEALRSDTGAAYGCRPCYLKR